MPEQPHQEKQTQIDTAQNEIAKSPEKNLSEDTHKKIDAIQATLEKLDLSLGDKAKEFKEKAFGDIQKWLSDVIGAENFQQAVENLNQGLLQIEQELAGLQEKPDIKKTETDLVNIIASMNSEENPSASFQKIRASLNDLISQNPSESQKYQLLLYQIDFLEKNQKSHDLISRYDQNLKEFRSKRQKLIVEKKALKDDRIKAGEFITRARSDYLHAQLIKKIEELNVVTGEIDTNHSLKMRAYRKISDESESHLALIEKATHSDDSSKENYDKLLEQARLSAYTNIVTLAQLNLEREMENGSIKPKKAQKRMRDLERLRNAVNYEPSATLEEIVDQQKIDDPIILSKLKNRESDYGLKRDIKDQAEINLLNAISDPKLSKKAESIILKMKEAVILIEEESPRIALDILKDLQREVANNILVDVFKNYRLQVDVAGFNARDGYTIDELMKEVSGEGVFNLSDEFYEKDLPEMGKQAAVLVVAVGAAVATGGIASAGFGALIEAGLIAEGSVIPMIATNVAIGYSSAVASRLTQSAFGDQVSWKFTDVSRDALRNAAMSLGIGLTAKLSAPHLAQYPVIQKTAEYLQKVTGLGEKASPISQFMARYLKELGEEGIEEFGESVHPALGFALSVLNSLDGNANIPVRKDVETAFKDFGVNFSEDQSSDTHLVFTFDLQTKQELIAYLGGSLETRLKTGQKIEFRERDTAVKTSSVDEENHKMKNNHESTQQVEGKESVQDLSEGGKLAERQKKYEELKAKITNMNIDNLVSKAKTEQEKQKLMEKLTKAKDACIKILDGKLTFTQEYAGLRDLGKMLKLDIEEQNTLAKKVLENSGRTMNDLVKIDEVLQVKEKTVDEVAMSQTIDAKIQEIINSVTDPESRELITKCWITLDEIVPGSDLLTFEERKLIVNNSINYLHDLVEANKSGGLGGKKLDKSEIFSLLQKNQRKLAYLNIVDRKYFTGSDHGVKHILEGNMAMAEKLMTQLGGKLTAKDKTLIRQAIIDHDLGYTINVLENISDASYLDIMKDHPLFSTQYIQENKEEYTDIFGEEGYETLRKAVLDHSNAKKVDLTASGSKLIENITAAVDCLGVTADVKMMALFKDPAMMDKLHRIDSVWKDIKAQKITKKEGHAVIEQIKNEMIQYIENSSFDELTKRSYIRALNMNFSPKNPKMAEFQINRDFGAYIGSFHDIDISTDQRIHISFNIHGENQTLIKQIFGDKTSVSAFQKAMDDYGLDLRSGEKIKAKVNGVEKDYSLEDFARDINTLKDGEKITIETKIGIFDFIKPTKTETMKIMSQQAKLTEVLKRNKGIQDTINTLENPGNVSDYIDAYHLLRSTLSKENYFVTINGKEISADELIVNHIGELRRHNEIPPKIIDELRQLRNFGYRKP